MDSSIDPIAQFKAWLAEAEASREALHGVTVPMASPLGAARKLQAGPPIGRLERGVGPTREEQGK